MSDFCGVVLQKNEGQVSYPSPESTANHRMIHMGAEQQVRLHISEAMFVWTGIAEGTVSGYEDRPSLSHTQINTSISRVSFQIRNPLT